MKTSELNYLIYEYSFDKGSLKWISQGGDLLKYIGQEVVFVDFKKNQETGEWSTASEGVKIEDISDFEPLTGTYQITYQKKDKSSKVERIIPQGCSFNNPEESGWMHRFLPYSLHFEIGETEMYFQRLKTLWNLHETLPVGDLETLKKIPGILETHKNLVFVVNTDTEGGLQKGLIAFRISEILGVNKVNRGYTMTIKDRRGHLYTFRQEEDKPITFRVDSIILGEAKIIDLGQN